VRILIVGAGAIGGYFGARLLAAGRDVSFLVRTRRAEQLRRNGLIVMSAHGDLSLPPPPMVSAASVDGVYDLVILSCKSYDLEACIEDFSPAMGEHSLVLPLLNGFKHMDVLDARFSSRRVMGGLARISSTLDADGSIHQLGNFNTMVFGSRDPAAPAMERITQTLQVPGFEGQASTHILHEMWEKWVFIAAGAAATCLLRATVGDIVAAGAQDIPAGLLRECSAIATANDAKPREASLTSALSVLTAPGSAFSASMLRDIEQGGRIEADHIIGDLLRRGAQAGPLPLLQTAYAHLRTYEARRARIGEAK
jgi:2-dehydropantoate 2-reductase